MLLPGTQRSQRPSSRTPTGRPGRTITRRRTLSPISNGHGPVASAWQDPGLNRRLSSDRHSGNIHPLEAGIIRRKYRKDRRPGLPIESPFVFYPEYIWTLLYKCGRCASDCWWKFSRVRKALEADPKTKNYTDRAIIEVD